MTTRRFARPAAAAIVAAATFFLSGCALLQPPPIPEVPRFGLHLGWDDAACGSSIAKAHGSFAAAGAAAGDPAATAAAHAAGAAAMSEYHSCLASGSRH